MTDSPAEYPRVAIAYAHRFNAEPGDHCLVEQGGQSCGLVRVITNDTPAGPLIIELGPDIALSARAALLP